MANALVFIVVAGSLSDRARKSDSKFAAGGLRRRKITSATHGRFLSRYQHSTSAGRVLQVVNVTGRRYHRMTTASGFEDRLANSFACPARSRSSRSPKWDSLHGFAVIIHSRPTPNDSIAFICRFHGIGNQLLSSSNCSGWILVYQPVYSLFRVSLQPSA